MATKKTTSTAAKTPNKTAAKKATPAAPAAKKAPAKSAAPAKPESAKPAAAKPAAPAKKSATPEEIARLAHSYWEKRGHHHGSHHDDWLRAEKELNS